MGLFDIFKKKLDYSGMTVNERLYHSGLMKKYDDAEKKKDIEKIKFILKKIKIDETSINAIIEKIK